MGSYLSTSIAFNTGIVCVSVNVADVVYDPVGGDVFDESTRCMAWNGRILIVGFTRCDSVVCTVFSFHLDS